MTNLEALVRSVTRPWAVPSGCVVVTDRHGVVDEVCFGTVSPTGWAPVNSVTRFQIGSISKIVTGLVVLRLVEDGALQLTQPIGELLGWLSPALRSESITIERLLQHCSGIISGVEAVPDPLGQLVAAQPRAALPAGESFHYSNFGYLLLGAAASTVTGQTLPELARRLVLEPASMGGALASITDADRDGLAVGTQPLRTGRPWWPGDPLEAAPWLELDGADGNVAASGRELAALGRLLLNRGARVVGEDTFAQMVGRVGPGGEPLLELRGLPASTHSRYGLGVNTELQGGRMLLSHGGGMVGYASFLLVDPTADRAVAVVTSANGDSPVAEAIARVVLADVSVPLNPARWAASGTGRARAVSPGMIGRFGPLSVQAEQQGDEVTLTAELDGIRSPLRWGWGDRIRAELPGTELFGLIFDGDTWSCGQTVYGQDHHSRPEFVPYCGHFRSYTPWFPHLRIVQRGGRLLLCAPGGVEAPGEESELFGLGHGVFAIGSPAGPEHVEFRGLVDGKAQWLERDGCRYSRSFTA